LQESSKDYFGIAAGFEGVTAAFQFQSQFAVVVNLAVENQHAVSIIAEHRLFAGAQIDDFETDGSERDVMRLVGALLIRTPVNQRVGRVADACRIEYTVTVCKSSYAAQMDLSPSFAQAKFGSKSCCLADLMADKSGSNP
jgi:hypothetical protein